ncbi:MAG: ferrous iron transport protein [Firmicutes bacterium]|nr:ferrous iron transport protein [Bacillota bacterium]
MYIEIIATVIIFSLAAVIFYKNVKRKASGKCDCSSCSSHCPYYKEKKEDK